MSSIPTKKELREFGVVIGFLFPLIIGFLIPKIIGHSFKSWTLLLGIPLFSFGFIAPNILFFPYKIWMRIGANLAIINSNLVLTLVFILIMQPTSLLMKLFKYDPLKLKKKKKLNSYKEVKNYDTFNIKKMF